MERHICRHVDIMRETDWLADRVRFMQKPNLSLSLSLSLPLSLSHTHTHTNTLASLTAKPNRYTLGNSYSFLPLLFIFSPVHYHFVFRFALFLRTRRWLMTQVDGVIDTDSWAQNGSTQGCVFESLKRRLLNKQDEKYTEILLSLSVCLSVCVVCLSVCVYLSVCLCRSVSS